MDILAHGLWTAAAAKAVNKKAKKPLNVWTTTFWGIFPDLFAFGIPFLWMFYNLSTGSVSLADLPHLGRDLEPVPFTNLAPLQLASSLYNISHSLVVFSAVFGLLFIINRKPVWELLGWLLHILIDIPTHSYKFFPTPILWPISSYKFLYGFSWGQEWFQIINYSALVLVYLWLWQSKKKNRVRGF